MPQTSNREHTHAHTHTHTLHPPIGTSVPPSHPYQNTHTMHAQHTPIPYFLSFTWVSSGCLRKSLTVAVRSCSCTSADSSSNVSRKCSSCSSALSMRSAYSPMIQMMLACHVGRRF